MLKSINVFGKVLGEQKRHAHNRHNELYTKTLPKLHERTNHAPEYNMTHQKLIRFFNSLLSSNQVSEPESLIDNRNCSYPFNNQWETKMPRGTPKRIVDNGKTEFPPEVDGKFDVVDLADIEAAREELTERFSIGDGTIEEVPFPKLTA